MILRFVLQIALKFHTVSRVISHLSSICLTVLASAHIHMKKKCLILLACLRGNTTQQEYSKDHNINAKQTTEQVQSHTETHERW